MNTEQMNGEASTAISVTATEDSILRVYTCHKRVRAAKITSIALISAGLAVLHFGPDQQLIVETEWLINRTDTPRTADNDVALSEALDRAPGGYFVRYEDGYASWSPADAFEKGYVPGEANQPPHEPPPSAGIGGWRLNPYAVLGEMHAELVELAKDRELSSDEHQALNYLAKATARLMAAQEAAQAAAGVSEP